MPTQQTVIPFAPASGTSVNADQLDRAGQTILHSLIRPGVAEENSRNAIEVAQGFRISCTRPRIGLRS